MALKNKFEIFNEPIKEMASKKEFFVATVFSGNEAETHQRKYMTLNRIEHKLIKKGDLKNKSPFFIIKIFLRLNAEVVADGLNLCIGQGIHLVIIGSTLHVLTHLNVEFNLGFCSRGAN